MTRARAWLNSSKGYRVAGALGVAWFTAVLATSHREEHGDAFLVFFVLAGIGGVLACLATGPLLVTTRLLNGGSALFLGQGLFLQGTYSAASFDRTQVIETLSVVGVVLVVNTVLAEFRLARARQRADSQGAALVAAQHAQLLAAVEANGHLAADMQADDEGGVLSITLRRPRRRDRPSPR